MARRVSLSRTPTASPTSGSFLTLADAREVGPVLLAEITLRTRGGSPGRTLRFSDRDFTDTDGNHWQPLIYAKTELDAAGRHLDDSWQPVDFDLVVGSQRLEFQSLTAELLSLLSEYEWTGSAVTVWQAFETLTDPTDWQIIFQGEVSSIEDMQPTEVTISCVQDRKWQVKFPPNTLNLNDYPELPTETAGLPAPILVGDWDTVRRLLDLSGTAETNAAYAGIARGAFPLVAIDAAESSTEAPNYFMSDGDMETAYDNAYLVDSSTGRLALSATAAKTNPAGGPATLLLTDRTFFLCILGVSAHANNTAPTWSESSKEDKAYNLTGYDALDFDANQKVLEQWLPSVSPLGEWVGSTVYIWYSKPATSASPTFGINNYAALIPDDLINITTAETAGQPSDIPLANTTNVIASSTIGTWGDLETCTLYADVGAAGDSMRVHRIALVIEFKASQAIVKATRTWYSPDEQSRIAPSNRRTRYPAKITEPASYSFNPSLLAYGTGVKDGNHTYGSGGDFTGTNNLLIEHPADFVHWLLVEKTKGLVPVASVTTGAATFGSFELARTTLANYKMLAHYGKEITVGRVLRDVSSQFLIWFHRNNLIDGQLWRAIPWDVGASVDYRSAAAPFLFSPDNVDGVPRVSYTSVSGVRNVVRVNFDHDLRTNSYAQEVFVSTTDSRGWTGSAYARDQNGGTPDDRETKGASSATTYGEKEEVLNLSLCRDAATATDVRDRYFDLMYRPRVVVNFRTHLNAVDLERGRVIKMSDDWDSIFPCPVLDSGGLWTNAAFRVLRVTRQETAATLYNVEAIEV